MAVVAAEQAGDDADSLKAPSAWLDDLLTRKLSAIGKPSRAVMAQIKALLNDENVYVRRYAEGAVRRIDSAE